MHTPLGDLWRRLRQRLAAHDDALARERENNALLDMLFRNAPVGLAFVDTDLRYVRVNEALAAATGHTADQLVGKTPAEALPEFSDEVEPMLRKVLETGQPVVGQQLASEVPSGSGSVRHWLSIFAEVTELKRVQTRLEELLALEQSARVEVEAERLELAVQVSTDALTGLVNRAGFAERIPAVIARARDAGLAVGLLYVDLDGFKEVNDRFGHAAGDELLRIVAARLRTGARERDLVARIGGDEFAVLLPDLSPATAPGVTATVAERIESAIAASIVLGTEAQVTASIGISIYPSDAQDEHALLARVDAAMYRRKRRVA